MIDTQALIGLERIEDAYWDNVHNGAQWLDVFEPDWYQKINIPTLAMISGTDCICGQLFMEKMGSFNTGYHWAYKKLFNTDRNRVESLGFEIAVELRDLCDFGLTSWMYEVLANAWIMQIEKRIANG